MPLVARLDLHSLLELAGAVQVVAVGPAEAVATGAAMVVVPGIVVRIVLIAAAASSLLR
jgi:hypothetical protein